MSDQIEQAAIAAQDTVAEFIYLHRAASIPALIGACALWAVEHGATDLIKGSLQNAIVFADKMDAIRKKGLA